MATTKLYSYVYSYALWIDSRWVLELAFVDQVIRFRLADQTTLESISVDLEEWASNPDAFYSRPHCETAGWKE